jgi:chaperonin GroEL
MSARQLLFDVDARDQLRTGIAALANAVRVTLGPRGRTVAIDRKWGPPTVINSGVVVAREFELENHFQNMGAQLLKQAAIKTSEVAGDGTTTSTILAQATTEAGLRSLSVGASPLLMKHGIDRAAAAVVAEIRRLSTPVQGHDAIERIATIAANDPEIGRLMADAMDHVGPDGIVTVEEGKALRVEVDYTAGMRLDRGYISPYFVTDPQRMQVELDEPYVLITDRKIVAFGELVPNPGHSCRCFSVMRRVEAPNGRRSCPSAACRSARLSSTRTGEPHGCCR